MSSAPSAVINVLLFLFIPLLLPPETCYPQFRLSHDSNVMILIHLTGAAEALETSHYLGQHSMTKTESPPFLQPIDLPKVNSEVWTECLPVGEINQYIRHYKVLDTRPWA